MNKIQVKYFEDSQELVLISKTSPDGLVIEANRWTLDDIRQLYRALGKFPVHFGPYGDCLFNHAKFKNAHMDKCPNCGDKV